MKKLILSSAAVLALGVSMAQAQSRGADLMVTDPHTGMQVRLSKLDTAQLTAQEIALLAQQLQMLSPQDRQKLAAALRAKMQDIATMAGDHMSGVEGKARGMGDQMGDGADGTMGDHRDNGRSGHDSGRDSGRDPGDMGGSGHDSQDGPGAMSGMGGNAGAGGMGQGMGRGN